MSDAVNNCADTIAILIYAPAAAAKSNVAPRTHVTPKLRWFSCSEVTTASTLPSPSNIGKGRAAMRLARFKPASSDTSRNVPPRFTKMLSLSRGKHATRIAPLDLLTWEFAVNRSFQPSLLKSNNPRLFSIRCAALPFHQAVIRRWRPGNHPCHHS